MDELQKRLDKRQSLLERKQELEACIDVLDISATHELKVLLKELAKIEISLTKI